MIRVSVGMRARARERGKGGDGGGVVGGVESQCEVMRDDAR